MAIIIVPPSQDGGLNEINTKGLSVCGVHSKRFNKKIDRITGVRPGGLQSMGHEQSDTT